MLAGLLTLNGEPLGGQQVLVVSADASHLVAWAVSDTNGKFSCEIPRTYRKNPLSVLVCVRTREKIGVVHQFVQEGEKQLSFALRDADFVSLKGQLTSTTGMPSRFDFFIDPKSSENIPGVLMKWAHFTSANTKTSYFHQQLSAPPYFDIKVIPGTYSVGGRSFDSDGPSMGGESNGYIIGKAFLHPDCTSLEGDQYTGFRLSVEEPTVVDLQLKHYSDY